MRLLKKLVTNLTGYDLYQYGGRSFMLFERKRQREVWFSPEAQLRALMEQCGIDLVLDVGANQGQFVRKIRPIYSGDIISFEPVGSVFGKLAHSASTDEKWRVQQLALGSREDCQTINVSRDSEMSSMLNASAFYVRRLDQNARDIDQEKIVVRRLDSVLSELEPHFRKRRIFLKMDTQGYDLEVFKGAPEVLKNVTLLQSELSLISLYEGMPHWLDALNVYEKAGFGVSAMFPVWRDHGRVVEYDCLMVKA